MMFKIVDTIGDKFIDVILNKLENTNALEMRELAAKFTADVIGNVAFGLECKCDYFNVTIHLQFLFSNS